MWTFNNVSDMGKDDSQNGLDLAAYGQVHNESPLFPCAPDSTIRNLFGSDKNRCATTSPLAYFELRDIRRAFQRLPVHSCSLTIACWAKMTGQEKLNERSSIIRWGATSQDQQGLTLNVRVSYGTRGSDGAITWNFGNHKHTVAVDWAKAGMRHLVFVYDKVSTQTTIYIDGMAGAPQVTCPGSTVSINQMVTYGRLEMGAFRGYMDEMKIIAIAWTSQQVQVDKSGGETVRIPSDIGDQKQTALAPTPMPAAPTPFVSGSLVTTPAPTTIQTRAARWSGPTPVVRTCLQICEDRCAALGKTWKACSCSDIYALPGEFTWYACSLHRHASLVHFHSQQYTLYSDAIRVNIFTTLILIITMFIVLM
jgi:hypothetical protein